VGYNVVNNLFYGKHPDRCQQNPPNPTRIYGMSPPNFIDIIEWKSIDIFW
jgi:hypothetical protein